MNALISISVKIWMLESVTCQRWACHTQSSMTEACFPCFQGSLSPPAYFNHQSTRCQTNLLEFHHSQSFFPPEHILATSHSALAQPTLFFLSRIRFFLKIPQQYKYLPVCLFFHSSFGLSWLIVDCFTTFLIGLPGGSMNQAARSV